MALKDVLTHERLKAMERERERQRQREEERIRAMTSMLKPLLKEKTAGPQQVTFRELLAIAPVRFPDMFRGHLPGDRFWVRAGTKALNAGSAATPSMESHWAIFTGEDRHFIDREVEYHRRVGKTSEDWKNPTGPKIKEVSFRELLTKCGEYSPRIFHGYKPGSVFWVKSGSNSLYGGGPGPAPPDADCWAIYLEADQQWIKEEAQYQDRFGHPSDAWRNLMAKSGAQWSTETAPSFADMEKATRIQATAAEKKRIVAWCKKMAKKQKEELVSYTESSGLDYRRGIADGITLVAHLLGQEATDG